MQSNAPRFETVEVDAHGPVGRLRLNRPSTRNALNLQLVQDIMASVRWFNDQRHVKAVVISGNGKGFCSGFDLKNFSPDASPEDIRSIVAVGEELARTILRMRPISIAAVHGHCVGGGVVVAGACDFRYASEDASFMLPETALGIPRAFSGVPILARELGPLMTAEFVLLCEFMPARRALELGMLNDVVPGDALEERWMRTTDVITQRSHLVLEMTKQQLVAARESLVSGTHAFPDAHLLYSGLRDEDSRRTREEYVKRLGKL